MCFDRRHTPVAWGVFRPRSGIFGCCPCACAPLLVGALYVKDGRGREKEGTTTTVTVLLLLMLLLPLLLLLRLPFYC